MADRTNRRDFLKTTALAGAGFWVAGRAAFGQSRSPNEKLNIACIGVGGKGDSDCDACGRHNNIVAICDVRDEPLKKKKEKYPRAKVFKDFRKMFDEMEKEIDAVTISTPDHMHAIAAMWAMQRGKHCYVQKPLTHDVAEARELTEAAKKYKVCTQMGNQGTTSDGLREAVEVIQSGAIGAVREVHVWTNRPVWPQGTNAILGLEGVQAALHDKGQAHPEVPAGLDWDLFLGTAPYRPYQPKYQPFNWRGWWDFGCGALGDMACHTANMAFMACKLGFPTSVVAQCSEYNPETFPMWSVVEYEFPEREGLPPLKWTWYDGGKDKPKWVVEKLKGFAHGIKLSDSGSVLIGEKGTLYSPNDYGERYYLIFDGKEPIGELPDAKKYPPPPRTLPRVGDVVPGARSCTTEALVDEWFAAIRANKPEIAMSNFSYAGPLTETVVLGCVALRTDKKLEWDGPNMKITNDEKMNRYLKREYRKGWEI